MTIFFTGDTHFGHANIIQYCDRPFKTFWEMDDEIISRWNSVVGQNDSVYHLGDFALYRGGAGYAINTAEGLNGKIFLIKGNHDHRMFRGKYKTKLESRFEWIKDYYELKHRDDEMGVVQRVILCHYPFLSWSAMHHGSWMIHGHCHGTLPEDDTKARIDVGVDCNNFTPVSWDEVKYKMTRKVFKPIDHHRSKVINHNI